jgi:hypothetical protein
MPLFQPNSTQGNGQEFAEKTQKLLKKLNKFGVKMKKGGEVEKKLTIGEAFELLKNQA